MSDLYSRLTYNNFIMINIVKTHITNSAQLDLRCTVCFELEPSLMRCKGPCKGPLCLKCATAICKTTPNAKCPQRCSDQLELEPCPDLKLELCCPFKKQCKVVLGGVVTFTNHFMKCPSAIDVPHNYQAMRNYLCSENHPLYFLDQDVITYALQKGAFLINSACFECGERQECRSYCLQCSAYGRTVVYCHDCMPIPCTKKSCPIGHDLIKVQVQGKKNQCDLCGFLIHLSSKYCYFDFKCFFYICQHCYKGIPQEKHRLVPLLTNLALKAKRNMSVHDIIMKKLMNKRNHQESVYHLSVFGGILNEQQEEDSEGDHQDHQEYDEDEVFQSDNDYDSFQERYMRNGSANEEHYSNYSNNPSNLSFDLNPLVDSHHSPSLSYSEIDYNEIIPAYRIRINLARSNSFQLMDSYFQDQEQQLQDQDDSFLLQQLGLQMNAVEHNNEQAEDDEQNDDY